MNPNQTTVLIFLIPFLASLIVPLFRKSLRLSQFIAGGSLLGSIYYSIQGLNMVNGGGMIRYKMGGWLPPFGIEWRLDGFAAMMALLVSTIAFVIVAATGQTVKREIGRAQVPYYMIVLLNVSSLLGLILTHDLFNLFVFLEVASLTGYALIASGDTFRGNVSSFRYLLIGTVGASFYLLGVGYLYAVTGTLNMSDLTVRLPQVIHMRATFLGVLLMLLGLVIKMGLFPFHGWLPDAYTYASDSASALIAPLMTKVMIYCFIRIFFMSLGSDAAAQFGISSALMWAGAIAVVAGSVMAFAQTEFKRILAYSSVGHIGLITMGLALAEPTAFMGALLHIVNHAFMKAALFLIAAAAYHRHGVRNIFDFAQLRGRMPYTTAAFSLAALSMIGVPPLAGFFSKWYILVGALKSGQIIMAGVVVFSSLLTALYFFRVIEQTFFQESPLRPRIQEAPAGLALSAGVLSFGLLVLGFFAPQIYAWGLHNVIPLGS